MTLTPVQQQLEELKQTYGLPKAEIVSSNIVVIPDYSLPDGWSNKTTTVRFVLPPAFPHANPDCFYADSDLRLLGGRIPQNTQQQAIPGLSGQYLWFSWHPKGWRIGRDTLTTYLRVIRQRFEDLR